MLARRAPVPGVRQVAFTPVETMLCLAAACVVDHRRFGSGSAPRAPEPVQHLARLFRRPPSSILAKTANLDGSRSHGATWDLAVAVRLGAQPAQLSALYRVVLAAARTVHVTVEELPDFLRLEQGGTMELLGQDELDVGVVEAFVEQQLRRAGIDVDARDTERAALLSVRVGQHVFAGAVLRNCGHRCVFCGLRPSEFGGRRMLLASHIKPWKDSAPAERLDHRNGLAACPTHDAAFDGGLLAVNGGLRIHVAPRLAEAAGHDAVTRSYFDRPPLRETLLLPQDATAPHSDYPTWQRERIFAAA